MTIRIRVVLLLKTFIRCMYLDNNYLMNNYIGNPKTCSIMINQLHKREVYFQISIFYQLIIIWSNIENIYKILKTISLVKERLVKYHLKYWMPHSCKMIFTLILLIGVHKMFCQLHSHHVYIYGQPTIIELLNSVILVIMIWYVH